MPLVRGFLSRLMAGRYGSDQLNLLLLGLYLILYLVSLFTRLTVLYWIALVVIFVALFRTFSRRVDRRRAENARFMQLIRPIQRRFKACRARMQDRDHRYFKCPNCGQQMRVPKGKGRITVHCRGCGATFEEKS